MLKSNPTACLPGKSSRSGEGDCPFGRDQGRHAFPPPARDAFTRTGATRTNRGKRPPGGAGLGSAWRCGRGNGPYQDAEGRADGKVSRFPVRQPMRGALFQHPVRVRARQSCGGRMCCQAAWLVRPSVRMACSLDASLLARSLAQMAGSRIVRLTRASALR